MKISYNWLKQFINIEWDAEKAGNLLTDLGLEVEGIETYESLKGGLQGVVVGKVLSCKKHDNADKLKVTTVDIGTENHVQIVCGAPNVSKGQTVAVATLGTTLYDENGSPWKIKKSKIRGVESLGMICAEDELGLGTSHDGILVLDDTLSAGTPCAEVFEIETDAVFDIGLTPNRSDAMSHFGVARDLRAGLLQQDLQLELITPPISSFHVEDRSLKFKIKVEDKNLAPRYCGVSLSGITISESPSWLKNRLKAIGINPKNNVVDVTNYVMHELGQPLHAFDANKLPSQEIQVKTLPSGTKFTTLDGVERELHEDDLMICSDDRPLCIAGVLGGMDSGVTENTSQVFLESAYFNPVSIRKTAKRHSINTDASFRFERGIDIELTEYALKRAAILINQLAGGTITSDVIDEYTVKFEETQVVLNFDKITKMIGQEIPRETIKSILTSLDIKINNVTEAGIGVIVPSYRVDVTREADLVEEILRVYGYNNIEFSKKIATSLIFSDKINLHQIENRMADQLISQGFFEMMNNSLTTPDHNKEVAEMVTMLNPLSQDLSVMRTSLLFQSLESIAYNLNRKQQDCKFFEFGKTYFPAQEGYTEHKHLVLAITGNQTAETWTQENLKSNFFYLKGVVEALMVRLGIRCKEQPTNSKEFSEGIDFVYNKKIIASLGLVASHLTNPLGITQQTLFADLQWDVVIEALKHTKTKFKHIPKNPAVRRDFALLLDKEIAYKDLYDTAYKTERNLLKSVSLFDVYEGKNLPENKKSYALSFTLQDQNKTLTDKQVDKVMNSIQSEFEKSFGAQLR
jgi:phenylalanyl-tRNA synthetase beta chain